MGKIATPQLNGSIVKANPEGNAQEELGKIFIDGRIYSIPGGASGGLYKHEIKFGAVGAEGQSHISFLNDESVEYDASTFFALCRRVIANEAIIIPIVAGWGNQALTTTQVFNFTMSAVALSEENIGLRIVGYPALTVNSAALGDPIYADFGASDLAVNFSDTVTPIVVAGAGSQGSADVEAIQAEIDRNVRTDWVYVSFLTSQNDGTASNLYSCNIRFYLSKSWLNATIAEQLSQYGITNIGGLCAAWTSNFRNGIGYSLLLSTVAAASVANGFKVAIITEYPPTESVVGAPYVNGTFIFSPDGHSIQSYANSWAGNDIEPFMANSTLTYSDTYLND